MKTAGELLAGRNAPGWMRKLGTSGRCRASAFCRKVGALDRKNTNTMQS